MIAVYLLSGLAAVGVCTVLRWVKDSLRAVLIRRLTKRVEAVGKRFCGKIVRHAPTGRVGLCVGAGYGLHKRWGILRADVLLQMTACPSCAHGVQHGGPFGVMMMAASGHFEMRPLAEVVSALACEAKAFSEAMEKGGEDANEYV